MAYVPDEAFDRSHEISASAFRLYVYFCKRANAAQECWPSLATIAADCHWQKSHASEYRRKLAAEGWIELDGDRVRLRMGYAPVERRAKQQAVEPEATVPKNGTPFRKTEQERSEIGNDRSEKRNEPFRKTESHVRNNQPIEPAHRTSPAQHRAPAHARGGGDECAAVRVYAEVFGFPPHIHGQEHLARAELTDTDLWQRVCELWRANGHKPSSIAKMVDRYRNEQSKPTEVNGNGRHDGNGRTHQPDPAPGRELTAEQRAQIAAGDAYINPRTGQFTPVFRAKQRI
jgi:hypothetical protein